MTEEPLISLLVVHLFNGACFSLSLSLLSLQAHPLTSLNPISTNFIT